MANRRFFSVIMVMLLLFTVAFGSVGCGGGGSSSNFAEEPNNPAPSPDPGPTPVPTPDPSPTPEPTPIPTPEPDPTPSPEPIPNSSFIVTFDSNGGTEVPSQQVEAGGTVARPDNPIKDGNVFVSWYRDNNDFKNMFLFGSDGDQITEDTTLYAQWLEYNPDLSKIQYAISQISIGYSNGDNSKHVTKNLTLPTKNFRDESLNGVTVTWSSNNASVIGTDGTVRRPQNDTKVRLTATVSIGSTSQSKGFEVNVVHANTRTRTDIHNNTITEIEDMNLENNEFYIGYNSDRTQVTNMGVSSKLCKIFLCYMD